MKTLLTLSLFRRLKDTTPHLVRVTEWQALKYLTTPRHDIVAKSKLPLWSPTQFLDGTTRCTANALQIHWLVYDIDDGLTEFDTWQIWAKLGYTVAAHTSYSHTPKHPKYRIAIPLLEPIPAKEWYRASEAALELWRDVVGIGIPDLSAIHDRARVYYQYGVAPDAVHSSARNSGVFLELDYQHIPKEEDVAPKVRRTRTHIADADTMLDTQVREAVAYHVGAILQGNEARQITCPSCGRNSVHYSIDLTLAGSTKWPTCNRLNKCGWYGHLKEL